MSEKIYNISDTMSIDLTYLPMWEGRPALGVEFRFYTLFRFSAAKAATPESHAPGQGLQGFFLAAKAASRLAPLKRQGCNSLQRCTLRHQARLNL